jgi:4'-phosphopantetheinyl transferase
MPRRLAPGDVHVWRRVTGALEAHEVVALAGQLSPDERFKCERFRFERDRRDYAAAHALLRRALSHYADRPPESWRFEQAPGGKPRLACDGRAPCLSFNLSHTRGLVACAISGGAEVGIDVERADRYSRDVAERFFSAHENDRLGRCGSDALRARRFAELWTLKEAYVKAIGAGLSHPLQEIEFDVSDSGAIRFRPPESVDPRGWTFTLAAPTPDHCLAVAVRHEPADRATIRVISE